MKGAAIVLLVCILPIVDLTIYVYNSQDSPSVELYDCIPYEFTHYCRRPNGPIRLARNDNPKQCYHGGRLHDFATLRMNNVTLSTILHGWRSTPEKVEDYALSRTYRNDNDQYLCECVNVQSFGKNCEYLLPAGYTLAQVVQAAQELKKNNPDQVQVHGNIICYTTLSCNSGLLCLDWRDLCDGVQQCMEGLDEENCDILEANECEENEYRCMNGLCIPAEYFLDGEFDCLDWSDELQYYNDRQCSDEAASAQCDDRYCPPNQWSCGDGQCIRDRFHFQNSREVEYECGSKRDQYFLCETHNSIVQSTSMSGRCTLEYNVGEPDRSNYTIEEECQYLLKCALSYGAGRGCPCPNPFACPTRSNYTCPSDLIRYPKAEISAPYVLLLYNRSRNFTRFDADISQIQGTIRCGHNLINVSNMQLPFNPNLREVEEFLCRPVVNQSFDRHCQSRLSTFSKHRSNLTDICQSPRECISAYRANDGIANCLNKNDELETHFIAEACTKMKRYRFRCSANETKCLSVTTLGDLKDDCRNSHDESWMGTGGKLNEIRCNKESKSECETVQRYIKSSWPSEQKNEASEQYGIPFRSYCDTFWNLPSKQDEHPEQCRNLWVCSEGLWRCNSGQCIDPTWVLDGEWDCLDASDENDQSLTVRERTSFDIICNLTIEYPCFRINLSHSATELTHTRLCIRRDQLGDGHIDCYGAIDEQNTEPHCGGSTMLGYHFKCASTQQCIPYASYCYRERCEHAADDLFWCRDPKNLATSQEPNSVFCFSGTRSYASRCDQKRDCPFGEDEYLCDYRNKSRLIYTTYRTDKQFRVRNAKKKLQLRRFPDNAKVIELPKTVPQNRLAFDYPSWALVIGYSCNRGVGVQLFNGSLVCFCPFQYYGDRCEYHSDRLTIVFHMDFSQSIYMAEIKRLSVLKLVFLLLFNNETVAIEIMALQPSKEIAERTKWTVYLLYSRSARFLQHKRSRYRNRSGIISNHPYSLRIEAYEGQGSAQLHLIAVWQYPIYFDYLPVYRLSKVLHLKAPSQTLNVCSSNPCPPNTNCLPLQNNQSQYICLCKANFTGENCSIEDQRCANNHCAVGSICKPNYYGHLNGYNVPLCICSIDLAGERCAILMDQCSPNPCDHNGSCSISSRSNTTICLCTPKYHGKRCELTRPEMLFYANETTDLTYAAVVLQFFSIDFTALNLVLVHQEVHRQRLPSTIENRNGSTQVPEIVLAKVYPSSLTGPTELYVISTHDNMAFVESTTQLNEKNRCSTVEELIATNASGTSENYSPIGYHQLCKNNTELLCFRDTSYLCICSDNNTRAECFGYDWELDRCYYCSSNGRCIQANRQRPTEFTCLCPPCFEGERCQFNMNSFGFTLDQLFLSDLRSMHRSMTVRLLIIVPLLMFFLALPNNLFSILTFRRQFLLGNSIAQYLFFMSIINQLNLGFLAARLIHLTAHILGFYSDPARDDLLCKLFSYLLVTSNRMVYWLSALVAIERMYMTLVINGRWLSQAHIARRLTAVTLGFVLSSKVHELFFVKSLSHVGESAGGICVLEFPVSHRSKWSKFHLILSVINLFVPLLINICSTITIICVVTKKKMNTRRQKAREFDAIDEKNWISLSISRPTK